MSQDRTSDDDHVELTIAGTDRDRGIAIPAFGIELYLKKHTTNRQLLSPPKRERSLSTAPFSAGWDIAI
jgi:hypothetical protein